MSVIEDTRKLFQDFVAPELRSLGARVEAADKIAEARHGELMARFDAVDQRFNHLLKSMDFDRRLEQLESKKTH